MRMRVRVRVRERELDSVWVLCTLWKLAEFCVALGKLAEFWRSGTSSVRQ